MRPTRVFCVLAFAAFAACSPRGVTSVVPAASGASSARVVQGSSVAYGERRFFVLTSDALRVYHAGASGLNPAPIATYAFPTAAPGEVWLPVDVVEAPDRTVYALFRKKSTSRGLVAVYAPNTTTIEQQFKLPQYASPLSIALVGDGIDVSTLGAVYTYAYAAGDTPAPIRTLNVPGPVFTDAHDRLYSITYAGDHGGNATVNMYAAGASGNAAPVRTIDAGRRYLNRIAVGPDNTIYGTFSDPDASFSVVQTIPRNAAAPRVVAEYPDPAQPAAEFAYSLSVDEDGRLYVGADNTPDVVYLTGLTHPQVDVYAADAVFANNANAPLRTMSPSLPEGDSLVAIATGN